MIMVNAAFRLASVNLMQYSDLVCVIATRVQEVEIIPFHMHLQVYSINGYRWHVSRLSH